MFTPSQWETVLLCIDVSHWLESALTMDNASVAWPQHGATCSYYSTTPTWWRHQMETFSALLAICAGNSPVPVNSQHKGQWRGALVFSLICTRINAWVNNGEAGDLRRNRGHYDVTVMNDNRGITTSNVISEDILGSLTTKNPPGSI